MKLVIDAYNLYHAARALAEDPSSLTVGALVTKIDAWAARTGADVAMVFDGTVPRGSDLPQEGKWNHLWITFSGPARSADSLIIGFIDSYSASRTLTVLSNDREILSAARRRRCKTWCCEAFWAQMEKTLAQPQRPREPLEKRGGLSDEDTDYWLKQFGMK